jgi:hypothetical protein
MCLFWQEKNFTLTINDGLLVSNLKQAIADEAASLSRTDFLCASCVLLVAADFDLWHT